MYLWWYVILYNFNLHVSDFEDVWLGDIYSKKDTN